MFAEVPCRSLEKGFLLLRNKCISWKDLFNGHGLKPALSQVGQPGSKPHRVRWSRPPGICPKLGALWGGSLVFWLALLGAFAEGVEINTNGSKPKDSIQSIQEMRVFSEPLVPVGRSPRPDENDELTKCLRRYSQRVIWDDFSLLESFIQTYPKSPWTPCLIFQLAKECYASGWYSKSLANWEKAWELLGGYQDSQGKSLADAAGGELASMFGRLGRVAELERLLRTLEGRPLMGAASEKLAGARQGLWTMQHQPGEAFKCGPYALLQILLLQEMDPKALDAIRTEQSTTNGLSMTQVEALSRKIGLNYQMAFRGHGAPWICPAVTHWKVGHYAALVKTNGGLALFQDPTFGNNAWLSTAAMEHETSGYFLVAAGDLPEGWRRVSPSEGKGVFGKGTTQISDPNAVTAYDTQVCTLSTSKSSSVPPMAISSVHAMLVSLQIQDTPIRYRPPVGLNMTFRVVYNQREASQPANFSYSNLGPKWTFNWLSYVRDNPSTPGADVEVFSDGGGILPFTGFNPETRTFQPQYKSRALLHRASTNRYELSFLDGSKIVFGVPDHDGPGFRRVFMSQRLDPYGNAVQLGYDEQFRLITLTDSLGQVTKLFYELPEDQWKVTKVADPFGRFATFHYDSSRRLEKITDPIGITSQFTYDSADFIQALITPYGVTRFEKLEQGRTRRLDILYPDGAKERVEYNESLATGIPNTSPSQTVPAGMSVANQFLSYRNTFHWDRKAFEDAPLDYSKAHLYHWLHQAGTFSITSGTLESEKPPLENRIWRSYDQQAAYFEGNSFRPNAVGRVLDDGTSQVVRYRYNATGQITNIIDPIGRSLSFIYSTNQVDLLEVKQSMNTNQLVVLKVEYNAHHRPVALRNASRFIVTNAYNDRGQLLTTTNPKGETTAFTYNTNGYLQAIDGPMPGQEDLVTLRYDPLGRVREMVQTDGYATTNLYDILDRITRVTFPDGSYISNTFDKLELVQTRDRLGRETHYTYDSLRRPVSIQDPLKRTIQFHYCGCGALESVIDPMGRPTRWQYDIQGRLIAKTYVDGSRVSYEYEEGRSRLKAIRDEKGQVKRFDYNLDDTLRHIRYENCEHATPNVRFDYDPYFRRLTSMEDGVGVTRFSYYPISSEPMLGAGMLASVDGPFDNDTMSYSYDEMGRVTARDLSGSVESFSYDPLGRLSAQSNPLGRFDFRYVGTTTRPAEMSYPNGQKTLFKYFDRLGDFRLEEIQNLHPDGSVLSKFDYTYDPDGQIRSWTQQLGSNAPEVWQYDYDAANQLLFASSSVESKVAKTFAYAYDFAGNRTLEVEDSVTNRFAYNALNEITHRTSAAPVSPRSYEWDGENRLTAIQEGGNRYEFQYDGLGRRVRITDRQNSVVLADHQFVWCGNVLCEQRSDLSKEDRKQYFSQGVIESGSKYFYTRDHLGSVREETSPEGGLVNQYTYTPYGTHRRVGSDSPSSHEPDFLFTGYFEHIPSGLALSATKAYDPSLSRWLSRNPISERTGLSRYSYASGNPVSGVGSGNRLDEDAFLGAFNGNVDSAFAGGVVVAAVGAVFPATVPLIIFVSTVGLFGSIIAADAAIQNTCHSDAQRSAIFGAFLGQLGGGFAGGSAGIAVSVNQSIIKWDTETSGFLLPPGRTTLLPGQTLIRWGPPNGRYFTFPGTRFGQVSIPGWNEALFPPFEYVVTEPVEVSIGIVAPYHGQPGMGTQILFDYSPFAAGLVHFR